MELKDVISPKIRQLIENINTLNIEECINTLAYLNTVSGELGLLDAFLIRRISLLIEEQNGSKKEGSDQDQNENLN